jgi:hypothetical protein
MLGAQGLWAGRDLYHATPTATRDLGFSGLIRRTAPFSRFLRHTRGCGGSILTRILTESKEMTFKAFWKAKLVSITSVLVDTGRRPWIVWANSCTRTLYVPSYGSHSLHKRLYSSTQAVLPPTPATILYFRPSTKHVLAQGPSQVSENQQQCWYWRGQNYISYCIKCYTCMIPKQCFPYDKQGEKP